MSDTPSPPAGSDGGTATTPPPAPTTPAKPPFDFKKAMGKLTLADKVLAVIALIVVLGWIFSGSAFWSYGLFKDWFATLSFLGAIIVVALLVLKAMEVKYLPPGLDKKVIAIASLLPVVGLLLSYLRTPIGFLTVGGSLALAYVSAMVYWRKHIPDFASKALDAEAAADPTSAGAVPPK